MRLRSTTSRGYGARHQQIRALLFPSVAAGREHCTRCGLLIAPGQAWDLDHSDDRRGYLGAAHASCNRRAGALKRNVKKWSRKW